MTLPRPWADADLFAARSARALGGLAVLAQWIILKAFMTVAVGHP